MSSAFKWRHFQADIILQCVRWYCKYGISSRDLEEMMVERALYAEVVVLAVRGIELSHQTMHH